jgi:hypothetical protein
MKCPYCAQELSLSWPRYWKLRWSQIACPACTRQSELDEPWRYVLVAMPLMLVALALVGLVIYEAGAFLCEIFPVGNAEERITAWREDWGVLIALVAVLTVALPLDRALDGRLRQLKPVVSRSRGLGVIADVVRVVGVGSGGLFLTIAVLMLRESGCLACVLLFGLLGWFLIAAALGLVWSIERAGALLEAAKRWADRRGT